MKRIVNVEIEIVELLSKVKEIEPEMLMDEGVYNECRNNINKLNGLFKEHEQLREEFRK